MAVERNTPYSAFNFRVTVDRFGDANSFTAGFQEVSGLGNEITLAEYRNGNEPQNQVRKIAGLNKSSDVTLKRGVIGSLNIFAWIKETREGSQVVRRNVTIELMDEAHGAAVMTWKLFNAVPMKYTGPTLNAKGGTDVAIEELVLACERLDVE
ncbi:MAG: phage tail protein [Chloroflexia bacterium]